MAEEIIIKVDGLQELKNIEATFKTFVTSINAAVTAIGATGGSKGLSAAIKKVSDDVKKLHQDKIEFLNKESKEETAIYTMQQKRQQEQVRAYQKLSEIIQKQRNQQIQDEALVRKILEERLRLEEKTAQKQEESAKKRSAEYEQEKFDNAILNKMLKDDLILQSQYASGLEKLGASMRILQREISQLVNDGKSESDLYRQKVAQMKQMSDEYVRLEKATGKAQMKQTGMYGATYQLSQVMRELPNFAIDARIGFLSLSNNLPMLIDSFKQLSMEIDDITGKPKGFKGAMEAFGKSLFGLNTVFVVATTLLTIYGEDIVKFVKGLFVAEKQVKNTTSAFSELNSVVNDGLSEYSNAIESINKVKSALKNSENGLKIYNNIFGETFGTAKSVAEALDLIRSKESAYIKSMQKMAIANAMFAASAQNAVKITDISLMSNAELLGNDAQPYIDKITEANERLKNGATEWVSSYDAAGNKTLKLVEISNNRLKSELLIATKNYNDAARKRQIELISDEQRAYELRLGLANKYYKESNLIAQNYGLNLEPQSNGKQSSKSIQQRAKYAESDFEAQNLEIFRKANTSIKNKLEKDREEYAKEYEKTSEIIVKQNKKTFSNVVKSFFGREEEANKLLEQQKEDTRQSQLETLNSLGSVTDSIAGLYDARIQKMNDYYDMEAARIEGSTMSEAQKNEALKRLDEKRYQEELKLFEQRKKFQIATVWIDAAAGIMNAWTTKSTTPSPWDVIERVAKSAAIVAMAVTQTANINAQKPNAPKSISSGGSATGMTATQKVMSPQKTAMTSSEENLNMMLSNREKVTSIVKVSEINNVQNRVAVRENNQMY